MNLLQRKLLLSSVQSLLAFCALTSANSFGIGLGSPAAIEKIGFRSEGWMPQSLQTFLSKPSPYHTYGAVDAKGGLDKFPDKTHILLCLSATNGGHIRFIDSTKANCFWDEEMKQALEFDGFSDVGMLIKFGAPNKVDFNCSGVLVGKEPNTLNTVVAWVLTAAHCVKEPGSYPPKIKNLADYLFLTPFDKKFGQTRDVFACNSKSNSSLGGCEYSVGNVLSAELFKESEKNKGMMVDPSDLAKLIGASPGFYAPDIALMRVEYQKFREPTRFAKILPTDMIPVVSTPVLLTQAGYGFNATGSTSPTFPGGSPNVKISKVNSDAGLVQLTHQAPPVPGLLAVLHGTRACKGDSGGPVFVGYIKGNEMQTVRRSIFGLISGGDNGATTESCKKSDWEVVQVFHKAVVDWLCENDRAIYGCPKFPN